MKKNIIEEIRGYVEDECKKPTSRYSYEPYLFHFIPMHKYAKMLAEKLNADLEIVELAAWLHDIGSIIYRRENHHITSARIAEEKLKELNYPEEKVGKVKQCILSHRGSTKLKRETVEAQIIADADAMSNFDNITGIFRAAFTFENHTQMSAKDSVRQKLINCWEKLSPISKEIVKEKYDAAMLLLD